MDPTSLSAHVRCEERVARVRASNGYVQIVHGGFQTLLFQVYDKNNSLKVLIFYSPITYHYYFYIGIRCGERDDRAGVAVGEDSVGILRQQKE